MLLIGIASFGWLVLELPCFGLLSFVNYCLHVLTTHCFRWLACLRAFACFSLFFVSFLAFAHTCLLFVVYACFRLLVVPFACVNNRHLGVNKWGGGVNK